VNEAKQSVKQRVVHEMREYLLISFYLFVVFSLFVVYKSVILAENHIDVALHGLPCLTRSRLQRSCSLPRSYILQTSSGTLR
jgi:hypothetical protein